MTYIVYFNRDGRLEVYWADVQEMNDYDLNTPTTSKGPDYKCCEIKMAAFFCLGCIMAVILAIVLVWFIRRKRKTKQYTLNRLMPKVLGPRLNDTLLYSRILKCVLEVGDQNTINTCKNVPINVPFPNRASNEHHFILTFTELSFNLVVKVFHYYAIRKRDVVIKTAKHWT